MDIFICLLDIKTISFWAEGVSGVVKLHIKSIIAIGCIDSSNTKEILTLAYSNKESLELTQKTGNSWFWSRSRKKLWMKGEESGNVQKVKEILVDCDSDAIIYLVEPSGPACHTGEKVCFHNQLK